MRKFITGIVACLILFSCNHAKAALYLNGVDGDWSNPVGPGTSISGNVIYNDGITVSYGNNSQDQVRWGTSFFYYSGYEWKSGLGFTGNATPLAVEIGDAFQIGQLEHFNNTINPGTELTSVDLTIKLTFTSQESFLFTFGVDETSNAGGPVDDIISFPSAYPSETFSLGGQLYTLHLLGFGDSPTSLLSQFSSPESVANDTLLWGEIELVPVPGAVLLGILGLSAAALKLRKYK